MWKYYDLTLTVDRLVGGIPKHPEIIKRWQEARWPDREGALKPEDPQTPEAAADLTVEALGDEALDASEEVQGIWTGLVTVDGQIGIESRNVKAMLKEAANVCRPLVKVKGKGMKEAKIVPLRSKLAERVFVTPKVIPLGVEKPTGTVEHPIHVMTARGPRTALKRTDYVDNAKVQCQLRVLDDDYITEDVLRFLLDYAKFNGLGTDRSQNNGLFEWELTEVRPG